MAKFSGLVLSLGVAMSLPVAALAAAPPECTPEQTAGLPAPDEASYRGVGYEQKDIDAAFSDLTASGPGQDDQLRGVITGLQIDYPFGSLDRYGFRLKTVIAANGRVSCASLLPFRDGEPQPEWTPQRREWADFISMWRFMPYLSGGKPVPLASNVQVTEYELPKAHVPMPAGDPGQVVFIQDMPYFGYHIELHGNGDAVVWSTRPGDTRGKVTYHVDPQIVAHILKEAEDADFWSLREVYPQNPKMPGDYASRIEIIIGGVTKSVTDYDDPESGMPQAGHFLAWSIRHDIPMGLTDESPERAEP